MKQGQQKQHEEAACAEGEVAAGAAEQTGLTEGAAAAAAVDHGDTFEQWCTSCACLAVYHTTQLCYAANNLVVLN